MVAVISAARVLAARPGRPPAHPSTCPPIYLPALVPGDIVDQGLGRCAFEENTWLDGRQGYFTAMCVAKCVFSALSPCLLSICLSCPLRARVCAVAWCNVDEVVSGLSSFPTPPPLSSLLAGCVRLSINGGRGQGAGGRLGKRDDMSARARGRGPIADVAVAVAAAAAACMHRRMRVTVILSLLCFAVLYCLHACVGEK